MSILKIKIYVLMEGRDDMKDIDESILRAVYLATTRLQENTDKNNEVTINITNITEDSMEKIVEEVAKNLSGLR